MKTENIKIKVIKYYINTILYIHRTKIRVKRQQNTKHNNVNMQA